MLVFTGPILKCDKNYANRLCELFVEKISQVANSQCKPYKKYKQEYFNYWRNDQIQIFFSNSVTGGK